MKEQELKILAEAKFEALKTFIYKLQTDYEDLQDSNEYEDMQPHIQSQIDGKVDVLDEIKRFIFNNS